ncbi:MAG: RNA-guided endonuclease TnpB family protein [Mobilicoccus sp.]|nr:RNA-guided endonuclease TnpB family protein [Mobilicoccus sp.]
MGLDTIAVQRAYRVVLDPTPAQVEALSRHAGASRAAFNHALAAKIGAHRRWAQDIALATYDPQSPRDPEKAYAEARKSTKMAMPGFASTTASFVAEHLWAGEVNRYAISSGTRAADTAWRNWLDSLSGRRRGRRVGYPRFKKRGRSRDSFTLYHDVRKPTLRPDGYRRLNLPAKVGGSVRLQGNLRKLARRIKRGVAVIASVTISRQGHRWVASILAREQIQVPNSPTPTQRAGGAIGVDVGVHALAALSTGQIITNPRAGRRAARRLTRAQRALSRTAWRTRDGQLTHNPRTPGKTPTAGRIKARARVARLQALLSEQRNQGLHRLTKTLATSHELIALEDLNVAGMTRSARGTIEQPGTGVAAKSGLNRSILDASFAELRRQITYKTSWYGARVILAPRFAPTSKTCATCGWQDPHLTLAQRTLHCPTCGPADRDVNAARNILTAALAATEDQARQTLLVASEKGETRNARGEPGSPTPPVARTRSTKREDPQGATAAEQSTARPTNRKVTNSHVVRE